jgi:hypothetical protein
MRWFFVSLLIFAAGGRAGASDPWEIDPCRETVLFTVPWGPDGFIEPANWGEGEPVWGPGPYAVDEDGSVFVIDRGRGVLDRLDAQGLLMEKVEVRAGAASDARDLAVRGGLVCWRIGIDRFVLLDRTRSDSVQVRPLPDNGMPFLTIGGHANVPNSRPGSLLSDRESILFLDWSTGTSWSLTRHGRVLSRAEEEATRLPGLPVTPSVIVHRAGVEEAQRGGYTEDGRRVVAGDLVTVSPDGSYGILLVEAAGWPLGVDSEGDFLVEWAEEVEGPRTGRLSDRTAVYLAVYSPQGRLLSRTREVLREFNGVVRVGPPYRIGEDCYYEWWVSREGAHLSRWSR